MVDSNSCTVTYGDIAQGHCAGPYYYVIADCRMALSLLQCSSTQNDPLINQHVISYFCCLSNDYSCPVVDKEPSTDFSSGVDLDTGQEAVRMGDEPGQKPELVLPKKMS